MEAVLRTSANGNPRISAFWLSRFYFGLDDATDHQRISAQGGLKRLIESRLEEIDARGVNSIPVGNDGRRGARRPVRAVPAARRG